MPRRKKSADVSAAVAKLTAKFTADLQALIEGAVERRTADAVAQLADVQAALQNAFGKVSKGAARPKAARSGRTSVADAKEAVYSALQSAGAPAGSGALQKATGLNAAQVRRALAQLVEEQLVGKEGERRATVYYTADTQHGEPTAPAKPAKPKTAKKRKAKKAE